jgi:hypothetical protein
VHSSPPSRKVPGNIPDGAARPATSSDPVTGSQVRPEEGLAGNHGPGNPPPSANVLTAMKQDVADEAGGVTLHRVYI